MTRTPTTVIRPLYLIPKVNVSLTILSESSKDVHKRPHAYCAETRDGAYEIVLNPLLIRKLWRQSWVSGAKVKVPYEVFESAMELHEVFHILYESFKFKPTLTNGLFHHIHNLLLDAQIEYSGTYEHPTYTQYIALLTVSLKRKLDKEALKDLDPEASIKVHAMLKSFFYLTRFGVLVPNTVLKESEYEAWINFIRPLIISSTRGKVENVMVCARAIYEYFLISLPQDAQKVVLGAGDTYVGMDQATLDEAQGMDQVIHTSALSAAQNIKNGQHQFNPKGGKHDSKIELEEKDTAFYRNTVTELYTTIRALKNMFKRQFDELSPAIVNDGDLLLDPFHQQNAYLNSFFGEDGFDYQVFQTRLPSIDFLTIRDISGSTTGFMIEYARLVVALMAAASDFKGIREAMIDFSDDAKIIVKFDEKINQARIFPRSLAGTQLLSALNKLKELNWKSQRRIVAIITDGGIVDLKDAEKMMKELEQSLQLKFHMFDISGMGAQIKGMTKCKLEEIPYELGKTLLRGA